MKGKLSNTILIAITETEGVVKRNQDKPLIERLKIAMKATRNHWLVTDEDGQFQAAVGAVLLTANEEETERIKAELAILKGLNAAFSGVPVNMRALLAGQEKVELIGLSKIWAETKD